MTVKQFFKSTSFKCIISLLCILLVCGIFLTIAYGFLEVTEGQRLQRAIEKIYSGDIPKIYGNNDKEITVEDKDPESIISEPVISDNAVISQMYKIVYGEETDYLLLSEGKDGYGGGTVTCWVSVTVTDKKIAGVRKVSISSNDGQSFIGKISHLDSYSKGYYDGIYYSSSPESGFLSSGATKSSNAINNAVNGAILYINENIFGKVSSNPFEGFKLLTYTNFEGSEVSSINTKLSEYTVENGTVSYKIVTCPERDPSAFTVLVKVGADKKISEYSVTVNGSTADRYTNKMEAGILDGTKFAGWGASEFEAVLGTELKIPSKDSGSSLVTGATQSNMLCYIAGYFAVANYDNCIAKEGN